MEIGYYCPECNKVHPYCWEIQGVYICSTCFNEYEIKLITLENFASYFNSMPLRKDALEHFKERQLGISSFTDKEKSQIITILNRGLRKEKLLQIFKNEK